MYPKLDAFFYDKLACPLCKIPLCVEKAFEYRCIGCGKCFTRLNEGCLDFLIRYPIFAKSEQVQEWEHGQTEYEEWALKIIQRDNQADYFSEIESVKEIYHKEFQLSGMILDVGGGHGRLRHFLSPGDTFLFIDPWFGAFNGLDRQPNLLKAYPSLREPCNFLCAQAERLPVQAALFDYVHVRSALDHMLDPYLALLEARRVLRPGGGLMIGLHVVGGPSAIREGSALKTFLSRLRKKMRNEGRECCS